METGTESVLSANEQTVLQNGGDCRATDAQLAVRRVSPSQPGSALSRDAVKIVLSVLPPPQRKHTHAHDADDRDASRR